MQIALKTDKAGLTGRKCPNKDCGKYFKIKGGTGLPNAPCSCPYCGTQGSVTDFMTDDQNKLIISYAKKEVSDIIRREFSELSQGSFGSSVSFKAANNSSPAIHYYEELQLEQYVICGNCTLEYEIYGVFGYCPDCRQHNSFDIFEANLSLAEKLAAKAEDPSEEVFAQKHLDNALEDAVGALDGFGGKTCQVFAAKAVTPSKVQKISFQRLRQAVTRVKDEFNIDLQAGISVTEWANVVRCFQKRHLYAHTMGVIDQDYIDNTGEPAHLIGRKVQVTATEVQELCASLRKVGKNLIDGLK